MNLARILRHGLLAACVLLAGLLWGGDAQAQLFLNVNKSFNPINRNIGQTSTLTITFANTSPTTSATLVAGTDTLPSGLAYVGTGAGDCSFVTNVPSLYVGGGTMTWSGGVVPPASSCSIGVLVTPVTGGTWVNTIPTFNVSGFVGTATVSGFSSASATITAGGTYAPLTGSKTASGFLHGDGTSSFVLTYNNPNALPTAGLGFTDTLPTVTGGTMAIAVPGGIASNSCGGTVTDRGGGSITDGDDGFVLSGGSIDALSSCSVTVVVRLPANTIQQNNAVTNSVPVGATTTLGVTSPAISVAMSIQRGATVSKTVSPATIVAGGTSTLTIFMRNYNLVQISSASLTDTFPAGVSGVSLNTVPAGCGAPTVDFNASRVIVTGATIPAASNPTASSSGVCTISMVVTAAAAGSYVNTIPAGTFTGGFAYGAASATLTVNSPITGRKAFTPGTVAQGGQTVLTLALGNASSSAATSLDYTDNMLATMGRTVTIVATPAPSSTCGGTLVANTGSTSFSITGGTIPANGTCTVTLSVLVDDLANPGTVNNTLPAGSVSTSLGTNSLAISGQLIISQAVSVAKSFSPNSIPQTGSSVLTITLNNAAVNPNASIISFTETLTTMGSGITIAPFPAASNTCGGTLTAVPGDTTISLVGGLITSGGNCQISMPVQASSTVTAGAKTNTVPAGNLKTDQGNNTSAATAQLTVSNALTATKAFSPSSIGPGQDSRMGITLTHANLAVAFTGMGFTDPFPSGHTVANPANASNTCGGSLTANPGSSTISLSGGALPTGQTSCSIYVDIAAPAGTGTAVNTLTVGSVTTNEGVSNRVAATASLTRTSGSPTTLNKSFSPVNIYAGERSKLEVLIVNPNAFPLTSVSLTDQMPAGMVVDGLPGASTSCGSGVVTANPGSTSFSLSGGTVPASGQCTFTANVTSYVGGNSINSLAVGSMTSAQGVVNNNNPSATLQVLFNVNIGKSFQPVVAPAGTTTTLYVTIYNSNTVTVAGLTTNTFSDVLPTSPAQMEVASTSVSNTCGGTVRGPGGAALAVGQTSFRLDGGSLGPSASCAVGVVVRTVNPAQTGTFVNTIPAGSLSMTLSGSPANNPTSAAATVTYVSNPVVTKTFTPSSIAPDGNSTLTFLLFNANSATLFAGGLTNASFTDTLPSGVTVRNPGPAGGSCAGAGGNTFSAGQSTIAFSGLTIPAAGRCTVTVIVTASALGEYVNTLTGVLTTQTPVATTAVTTATLTVLTEPTVSKSFSPSVILSSGTGTTVLTIQINNPNTVPVTLASPGMLDLLPTSPGQMSVTSAGVSQTCGSTIQDSSGGGFGANDIGIRANGGSVPAGGSCTIAITVTVAQAGTYLNNMPSVTTTNAGSSLVGATAAFTVTPAAHLAITKTDGASSVSTGQTTSYSLTVANLGPAAANGATVVDAPVTGLVCTAMDCVASGGAVCPASNLSSLQGAGIAIPTLPSGGQVVFVLTCGVTATGQ